MPKLFIMVGISGSGKSTIAESLFKTLQTEGKTCILIQTDEIRKKICGNAEDQSKNYQVFQTAHREIEMGLSSGFDVIFDATNLTPKDRSVPIQLGRKYGADIVAIVVNTPLAVSLERNKNRVRKVPLEVILKQQAKFIPPAQHEVDEILYQ
jgi:protein phosphatase